MNKLELTKDFRKKGWRVQKPDNWNFLEDREIKERTHKIYQVQVKDPDNCFGLVEVAVLADGETNSEGKSIEMVKPLDWEDTVVSFEDDLREFLDEKENAEDTIFAISVENVNVEDEVAEVVVYNKGTKGVDAELCVVRRRGTKFQLRKINNQTNIG